MKKIAIISLIVFTICIIGINNAFTLNEYEKTLKEDKEFAKNIEALSRKGIMSYIYIDDIKDVINLSNLIIRCKVTVRYDSTTINPLTKRDNEKSKGDGKYTPLEYESSYIATPYEMEILEVYHGDINKENDKIIINAPYGITDNIKLKLIDHPIFKIQDEYILFLNVVEIYGDLHYYISYPPVGCLTLNVRNGTFESDGHERIYSKYENKIENLLKDSKNLINENNFNTAVEKLQK